jgi:microcin C transport system permease protein
MIRYVVLRLLLLVPTLLAIIAINFVVVQLAPGGPVEAAVGAWRGAPLHQSTMVAPAEMALLQAQYGFDRPVLVRFFDMVRGYARFDLGESFDSGQPVAGLIWDRLPVSLSLGLWSTLLVYLVAIPLGIVKAMRDGSRFDVVTSLALLGGVAVPGFLLAVLLALFFGQGGVFPWFPLGGLGHGGWDYVWHLALPLVAMTAGGFASLTMLMKTAFLEEMGKLYVTAARAKGASERRVMVVHVLRNAVLPLVAGLPGAFVAIFFSSALFVEIVFSLNGLGLLGYEAVLTRDYPVMFGTLYVYTLVGLAMRVVGDVLLRVVDPRVGFESK